MKQSGRGARFHRCHPSIPSCSPLFILCTLTSIIHPIWQPGSHLFKPPIMLCLPAFIMSSSFHPQNSFMNSFSSFWLQQTASTFISVYKSFETNILDSFYRVLRENRRCIYICMSGKCEVTEKSNR